MDQYKTIYPNLEATAPPPTPTDGPSFRLQQCCDALNKLKSELSHYETVLKKYNRSKGVLMNVSSTCGILSCVLAAGGLGTSLSGVGIIASVPLGVVSGVFVCASIALQQISKRLSNKAVKHQNTITLARSKINTIEDLVSKALSDNKISDEQFSLIIEELKKFEKLKAEIRAKAQTNMSGEDPLVLRQRVRNEILKELKGGP